MTTHLRWGILSTANINRALIPQMHLSTRSQLKAVASRNLEKATAYANKWEIPQAYGSYEALLADPEIDAVYISLPNTLHAEWTIAAAKAGKHILCEKPIVQTVADLDAVQQAARDNDVHLVEAFANLHHPQQHQVRELVKNGRIGTLRQINGWFYFYLAPERADNIRLSAALGGGSMWDIGVYSSALSVFYADGGKAPTTVWGTRILGESGVDTTFTGQMQFANGVTAQIRCGFHNAMRQGLHLVGDAGVMHIPEPHNLSGEAETKIFITDTSGAAETVVFPAKNTYLSEVEAMEACVLDGAEPRLPLSASREFLRTVLALQESAWTNDLVHL